MWSQFWKASGQYQDGIFLFLVNNGLIILITEHSFFMETQTNPKKYKEDVEMSPNPITTK